MKRYATAAVLALLVMVALTQNIYAATGTFDPSASWSDWFNYWTIYGIQTVAGWFGKCYPDITGTACMQP